MNPLFAQSPTVAQLEQKLKDSPTQAVRVELAEAYLTDCQLDKSLAVWRTVLASEPDNKRAQFVIARLTAAGVDLDAHLSIIESLIDKGIATGVDELLAKAGERAAGDEQKARVEYLFGRLEGMNHDCVAGSRARYETLIKLYPNTPSAGLAAVKLAELEFADGRDAENARRLLDAAVANAKLPEPIRQQAALKRVMIDTAGLPGRDRVAALEAFLKTNKDVQAKRDALHEIVLITGPGVGGWSIAAMQALGEIMRTNPPGEQLDRVIEQLFDAARTVQRPDVLAELWAIVEGEPPAGSGEGSLRFRWGRLAVETLLAQAVVAQDAAAVDERLTRANGTLDSMAKTASYADRLAISQLRGRAMLIEAQKLAVLKGSQFALPALLKARDHYLAMVPGDFVGNSASGGVHAGGQPEDPSEYPDYFNMDQLARIGRLLEKLNEFETAVALYRQIATQFPHLPAGRDALLRVADLLNTKLDSPVEALDVYADYAARYPAELPYRQLSVGDRLKRLGYANLLDFQKRNNLKTDGLFGPTSDARLRELEASFDLIALSPLSIEGEGAGVRGNSPKIALPHPNPLPKGEGAILRGEFVHPTIFAIAQKLENAGRHREAIYAYRLFINLFPTKAQADNAQFAIARLFRANLLFDEALGAYRQMMTDFAKGDMTSSAYIEAAACLENLGRWKDARELYELYVRKFPKYPQVALCKERMELLDQVNQYAEFIAASPASPRLAEAKYQIATILYKSFGNFTKAAVEFRDVADNHAQHPRAADGLFTAGTCQLKAENFSAARRHFADLVARYPESRLADDAQYWVGHTYEYAARALGKLDDKRIVLKRRTLTGQSELVADAALRNFYKPERTDLRAGPSTAPAGPGDKPARLSAEWSSDTLGVLTSGSKRDRVNADLFAAVEAYRKVVDQFKMGDMAGNALLRIGTIYTAYLDDADKGAEAYRELLANYPGSREAVDALFEVGSYQVKQSKFDEAIKSYQQFIYKYPDEKKVEDAMMAVARCHAEKKAWDKALDAYQAYLNKYPSGKFASQARSQIDWIRMYQF